MTTHRGNVVRGSMFGHQFLLPFPSEWADNEQIPRAAWEQHAGTVIRPRQVASLSHTWRPKWLDGGESIVDSVVVEYVDVADDDDARVPSNYAFTIFFDGSSVVVDVVAALVVLRILPKDCRCTKSIQRRSNPLRNS